MTQGPAAAALQAQNPILFPSWFGATDITRPEAAQLLTQAVKSGAKGFGELKYPVAADGPEMRRVYDLAAELNVPVLIHFQEIGQPAAPGGYNTGIKRFAAILKAYPRTRFIGHADAFWANISADYHEQEAYPTGPIVPGGVTDKLLSDYPNLFADTSANSANNALSRDAEFTKGFLPAIRTSCISAATAIATTARAAARRRIPTASHRACAANAWRRRRSKC